MKKLTQYQKILADVDDELWLIMKRIELKHNLTWVKARDAVNQSILELYCKIRQDEPLSEEEDDMITIIKYLELENGKLIPEEDLLKRTKKFKLSKDIIEKLMRKGEIFMPKKGFIARI